jgi:hypothetical protein
LFVCLLSSFILNYRPSWILDPATFSNVPATTDPDGGTYLCGAAVYHHQIVTMTEGVEIFRGTHVTAPLHSSIRFGVVAQVVIDSILPEIASLGQAYYY